MWDGYVNTVNEFAAAHEDVTLMVVIDRFHVATHYRDASRRHRVYVVTRVSDPCDPPFAPPRGSSDLR